MRAIATGSEHTTNMMKKHDEEVANTVGIIVLSLFVLFCGRELKFIHNGDASLDLLWNLNQSGQNLPGCLFKKTYFHFCIIPNAKRVYKQLTCIWQEFIERYLIGRILSVGIVNIICKCYGN